MSKDIKNIWNAYKLLNEISQRDMDLVRYDRPVDKLPFDNIFGDKLRVVIPLGLGEDSDSKFDVLLDRIKEFFNSDQRKEKFPNMLKFVRFDYKTKKGIIRLQTQMGEKDREETLSSLMEKMFKSGYVTKSYRDESIKWIEQNIAQVMPSSYVVLSRSVIDNLRMSDISGIESCHSPGGGYYSSCLAEAAGGGVVAFVIDGGELKKKQIENIEVDKEIFSDKDRSVEGLDAVYRLRMRKYYSSATDFFVLPETKVYTKSVRKVTGNSVRVPGLVEVLIDFLKSKQELNKEDVLKLFTDKDIVRKGGSYEDTADSYLFNQYFGGSDFKGYIPYDEEEMEGIDEEEAEQAQAERRYNQFQQELRHFLRNSGVLESQHVDSGFDVELTDDNDVYYQAWGGIDIDLDDIELIDYDGTDDELEELEPDELNNVIEGIKPYVWMKVTDKKTKFYRVLFSELKKIKIDKDEILKIRFNRNGYTIHIDANLYDYNYEDGQHSSDPDNYQGFLRTLMEWNEKHDKIKVALIRAMFVSDYADLTENQKIEYGLADYDETKREFKSPQSYSDRPRIYNPKNLKFQGNWASFVVQTEINPTYLYTYQVTNYGNSTNRSLITGISETVKNALTKYIRYKINSYSEEEITAYNNHYIDQELLNLESYNFDVRLSMYDKYQRWIHLNIKFQDATDRSDLDEEPSGLAYKVSFEFRDDDQFIIKAIDTGINDIKNIVKACFIKALKPEEKQDFSERNLLKHYDSYISYVDDRN